MGRSQATREEFLDHGRALLIERGLPIALTNVSLVDVAKAAGRTTGAGYHIWDSQEAFHRDLIVKLAREIEWGAPDTIANVVTDVLSRGGGFGELVRDACNAYLLDATARRAYSTFVFFRSIAVRDDEVRAAIRDAYDRFHEEFRALYEGLLAIFDLELLEPFTLNTFTVAMTSLTEGFLLRRAVDPDRVPLYLDNPMVPEAPTDWSLYAVAVERFVRASTRPRSPGPTG